MRLPSPEGGKEGEPGPIPDEVADLAPSTARTSRRGRRDRRAARGALLRRPGAQAPALVAERVAFRPRPPRPVRQRRSLCRRPGRRDRHPRVSSNGPLTIEVEATERRREERRLRFASFPSQKTLADTTAADLNGPQLLIIHELGHPTPEGCLWAEVEVVKVVPPWSKSPPPTTGGCTLRRTHSSPFPAPGVVGCRLRMASLSQIPSGRRSPQPTILDF